MAQPSGSLNGGIIGASNKTSFGKGRITEKTSTKFPNAIINAPKRDQYMKNTNKS